MDNDTPKKRASIKDVLSSPSQVNEIKEEGPKEVVKERVIVQYRDKPRGYLNGCGCGCRSLGCGLFLIILLIVAGFVYIFAEKPAFIWSTVVSYLNAEERAPEYEEENLESLQQNINSQVNTIGNVQIILTENQVTTLVRNKVTQLKDVTVKLEDETVKFYWHLDDSLPSKPLLGIIKLSYNQEGKLILSEVGTGKVKLPNALNGLVTHTVYSALNLTGDANNLSETFIKGIFQSENLSIKSINFEEGTVKIEANITVNLFEQ